MTCVRDTTYCNCDTHAELRLTPQDLFQLVEDERAEFEATFRDLGFCVDRYVNPPEQNAIHDYFQLNTGGAWVGWLAHACVEWVPPC